MENFLFLFIFSSMEDIRPNLYPTGNSNGIFLEICQNEAQMCSTFYVSHRTLQYSNIH